MDDEFRAKDAHADELVQEAYEMLATARYTYSEVAEQYEYDTAFLDYKINQIKRLEVILDKLETLIFL